jgi:aspartyl-tRNA(Asn)/glutamyl-tRNA(Gln) amidotransferase subunit B
MRLLSEGGRTIAECALTPEALAELAALVDSRVINGPTAKELLPVLFASGGMPGALVKARGLGQVSDVSALEGRVEQALAANPKSAEDYRAGKKAAAGFLVGQSDEAEQG